MHELELLCTSSGVYARVGGVMHVFRNLWTSWSCYAQVQEFMHELELLCTSSGVYAQVGAVVHEFRDLCTSSIKCRRVRWCFNDYVKKAGVEYFLHLLPPQSYSKLTLSSALFLINNGICSNGASTRIDWPP